MSNISANKNCFGCGVCTIICPYKLINIKLSADGFYIPVIESEELCIHCGLCVKVCSYLDNSKLNAPIKASYAAYNKDSHIRNLASSGGVAYAIADSLLHEGYKICSVRYNYESHRAEHYIASKQDELLSSIGSKYMQSYSQGGFENISNSDKYMVVGTPCMIASMRKFIEFKHISNNFILVDFFCHGVPSKLLWDKYKRLIEKKTGEISHVSWRNKEHGWHNSYRMVIKGNKGEYAKGLKQGDIFLKLFLGDYCLNDACYSKCKFKKTASAADFRIGDLWGETYAANEEGYSALLVYTERGEKTLCHLDNLVLKEETELIITEGQMNQPVQKPYVRQFIMSFLKNNHQSWWKEILLITVYEIFCKFIKIITKPHIVIKNRLICLVKK